MNSGDNNVLRVVGNTLRRAHFIGLSYDAPCMIYDGPWLSNDYNIAIYVRPTIDCRRLIIGL